MKLLSRFKKKKRSKEKVNEVKKRSFEKEKKEAEVIYLSWEKISIFLSFRSIFCISLMV